MGVVQLLKNAASGNARNLRTGSGGELIYDNPSLDTPAAAMGSVVQTLPGAGDPDVLKHEMRHVAQSNLLGPTYLPLAIGEAVGANYGAGSLERDAIQHATPQSEILRKGSSMYEKPADSPALSFLQGLLK